MSTKALARVLLLAVLGSMCTQLTGCHFHREHHTGYFARDRYLGYDYPYGSHREGY